MTQCLIEGDRFEFNEMVDVYIEHDLPKMELIRDQPQISALIRDDKKSTRKALLILLSDLNNSFKVKPEFKLNESELVDLVISLSKKYYHYRMQDFAIFVKNAKEGKYGKSYNRLDVPMIHEWIGKYDYDRDGVIESNHLKNKDHDGHQRGSATVRIQDNPEFRRVSSEHTAKQIREKEEINVNPKEKKDESN